jgi:hypothetical protein
MVKCVDCDHDISYTVKVMAHQFLWGLIDPTVQEKVLAKASDGQELTLKELIRFVEAQEMGRRSHPLLSGTGGLNMFLEYHKAKGNAKGVHRGGGAPPGGGGHQSGGRGGAPGGGVVATQAKPKCGYCGHGDHGSSQAERAGKCPALGKDCNKCKKSGHFAHCCPSRGAVKAAGAAVAVPVVAV